MGEKVVERAGVTGWDGPEAVRDRARCDQMGSFVRVTYVGTSVLEDHVRRAHFLPPEARLVSCGGGESGSRQGGCHNQRENAEFGGRDKRSGEARIARARDVGVCELKITGQGVGSPWFTKEA
jgi:hypothetical protein